MRAETTDPLRPGSGGDDRLEVPLELPGGRSITAYLVGLAALFLAALVTTTVYQHRAATHDAVNAAARDARFAARLAASSMEEMLATTEKTVGDTAANPGLPTALENPEMCRLQFGGTGPFATGHIDVVTPEGRVVCSSTGSTEGDVYAGAAWLAEAQTGPLIEALVTDARTGNDSVVVASPAPDGSAVVAVFLDLVPLGASLTEAFGGPRQMEFVISAADEPVVLSRTADAADWVGADASATSFRPGDPEEDRRGLDGERRLFGTAEVPSTGWRIDAGVLRDDVVAPATRITRHDLALGAGFLVAFLIAGYVVHRRIGRPLRQLNSLVAAHAAGTPGGSEIPAGGPAEVQALARRFASLIGERDREARSSERAVSALQEAELRLHTILDNSPATIHIKDLDGRYVFVNRRVAELAGRSRDELIGSTDGQVVPRTLAASRRATELRVISTREPVQVEERLAPDRAGGGDSDADVEITYLTVTFPLVTAKGEVYGTAAIGTDITELQRVAAERASLQARLNQSQRLESLGQLAGGVAHDFNNLLAVILNYASFVAERTEGDVHRDVQRISEAAERAARLTHQLLVFARRETIRPQSLDLNEIVESIRGLLDRTIGEDIRLEVRLEPELPPIHADRGQVDQVLLNLAVNARDAMPDGGTLTLETRRIHLDEDYARLHPDARPGPHVQLVVSDTGVGMPPEVAARVFEPFFSTKPAGRGTGLGLATVYGIVTEVGGSVHVYSEEGLGTTFRITLPVAPAHEEAEPQAEAGPAADASGHETILVVEDEPAMLEVTSRLLTRNGYRVLEASSANEAMELAAAHHFDLLLTDSVMPSMSGSTLTELLKQQRPGLAVLFMSGYSQGVLGPRRLLDEDVRLIQKPFTEGELLAQVRDALRHG